MPILSLNWIPLKLLESIEEYTDYKTTKIPFNDNRTSHHTIKCRFDKSHTTNAEMRFCEGHKIEKKMAQLMSR